MDTSINSGDDYNSLADLNRDQVFDVDQSYDADPDFAYEDEQQHLGEQSTVHGSTSIDTFPSTLDAEMFPETIPDSELSQEELARRQKSNAKAVECLDLDGNLIKLYKSGMAASQELNIPQGDISLCCRGLKLSHMGYRFRFYGDKQIKFETTKLKRGFVVEPIIEKIENTRTTRASRGEYGSNRETKSSIFPPSDIKVIFERL